MTISGNGSGKPHASSAVKIKLQVEPEAAYDFGIKIHKVDENNKSLKGARSPSHSCNPANVIGEFETNKDGEIVVKNLLKTNISSKEISAQKVMTWQRDLLLKLSEFQSKMKPVDNHCGQRQPLYS